MDTNPLIDRTLPDLSVVIVNWNTRPELRNCLRSVMKADTGRMEVFVIDNASADCSADMVRQEFPSVHLIENTANVGFAVASNQGIKASTGRYVLLLNPDSEVQPRAFSSVIEYADSNRKIGIIGIKILNSDGTLQFSCRGFPTLMAGVFRNTILGHFFPNNPYTRDYLKTAWDHNAPSDVDWVSGAAMVLRRELIEDIGMLDEAFFMYCEDVDIGYRAHKKGWRVGYFPGAVVTHARGKSSDKRPNLMILEHHKSMYYFFKKHYLPDTFLLVRALVPVGLVMRASFFIARNEYYRGRNAVMSLRHDRNRRESGKGSSNS